jgi:hypothetical protein
MPRYAQAAKRLITARSGQAAWCYGFALAIGVLAVSLTFPRWALLGRLPPAAPYGADFADQVVAQRYFLAQAWHWHVLHIDRLMQPWGINLAFADGMPLASLMAKVFRPLLPPFDQVVTIWLALCWLAQPVAAVFAVRSVPERRFLVAVSVAVLASCQPTFLARLHHATLSTHFPLLVLLGCYFRAVRGSRTAIMAGCVIAAMLMLVHPYLLFMGFVFPAAVCVTLWMRGDRLWRFAGMALGVACVFVLVAAIGLGLAKGGAAGVYGIHSLNLMGLFYPARSGLFSGFPFAAVDATGGQDEGYAYLGAGLFLVLAFVTIRPRLVWLATRRHSGLALACVVLTLLALSHRAFFFHTLILHLSVPTRALNTFRASGRFVWIATYTMLVGGVVLLSRAWPRVSMAVLPLAAVLACLDGRAMQAHDEHLLADPAPWFFPPDRMRALLRDHERLTILPPADCVPGFDMGLMQPLWIAAETLMPTNTMYIGRRIHYQSCDVAAGLARPPDAGEIILVQPGFLAVVAASPQAGLCRQIGAYAACTVNAAALQGLPMLGAEVPLPARANW